jgi:hypothetical protein
VPLAARTRILASALVAGILLTVLALLPVGAGAQDAAKPAPCTGEMLITDKAGDQEVDPTATGLGPTHKTPDNSDVTGVFLNYKEGADGKKVLTANLQITNLTKDVPPPTDSQGGVYYYVLFNVGDTTYFVKAVNDGGDIVYQYGSMQNLVVFIVYSTDGDTKGQFFEGPNGVVQIEIPDSLAKPDAKLTGVMGFVDYIQGTDDFTGTNIHVDAAPDDAAVADAGTGKDYTVEDCPAASTTPSGPTTTPTTTELPLKVTKVLDGAKKAAKKKALRLTVNATNTITDLSLALKGKSGSGPTFASAKAASVNGTKTLKLKVLKPKKLKKGTYTLIAKGTLNGTKLSAKLKVTVKK